MKAICLAKVAPDVRKELENLPGVLKVITTELGGPAHIIGEVE